MKRPDIDTIEKELAELGPDLEVPETELARTCAYIRHIETRVMELEAKAREIQSELYIHACGLQAQVDANMETMRVQVERAQKAEACVAELEAKSRETRRRALKDAAMHVCDYCGKNTLPNEPEAHELHGPNNAGNYIHKAFGRDQLCKASSIWSMYRWEAHQDEVEVK